MDLLDLQNLTQEERTIILNVLRRDDDLRRNQENRISQIKQEIHNLRRNSVLRSGDDLSKICARCKSAFGLVTKTGEICPVCRFRVCRNCRDTLLTGGWLCSLCFKENQLLWLTGEWMTKGKEKFPKSRYSSGTELLRASLRVKRPNGRFSSDYNDYDSKENGVDEKTAMKKGSLAGAEERAGHNNASRTGQNNHYSADSADKKPLSNLLGSFRSGLGASSDGHADGRVAGAVGGGGGVGAGAGMVVQHVSCRRRHDSNSSSNSDSDSQVMGNSKKIHSGTNSAARASSRGESGARREYSAHSLDSRSGENDARIKKSQSHSQRSETSGNTIKEKSLVVGKARDDTERPVEASSRVSNKTRKSELPQSVRGADSRQRKDGVVTRQSTKQSTSDGERPSSGCSFTSSEWGEVTPTESAPSNSAPRDRKEEVGSALGQSSGYVSSSRKSLDVTDSSQQLNQDSPSPSKSKSSPSKLPVRQNSKDSYHDVSRAGVQRQASTGNSQIEPQPHNRHNKTHAVQSHVRRQSSGRSETLSTCSANTASPGTKMRLLDLASNRALERDGEDSVKSWSGGSEDTMSLGMSCSGIPASADTPVFQKVHHRHQKVCDGGHGEDDQTRATEASDQAEDTAQHKGVFGSSHTYFVVDSTVALCSISAPADKDHGPCSQGNVAAFEEHASPISAGGSSEGASVNNIFDLTPSETESQADSGISAVTSPDDIVGTVTSTQRSSKTANLWKRAIDFVLESRRRERQSETRVSDIEDRNIHVSMVRSPTYRVPDALLQHLREEENSTAYSLSSIPEEKELEDDGIVSDESRLCDKQVVENIVTTELDSEGVSDAGIHTQQESGSHLRWSKTEEKEHSSNKDHIDSESLKRRDNADKSFMSVQHHDSIKRHSMETCSVMSPIDPEHQLNVAHETDGRHTPAINQSRQSDGDYTGASDVSDHGRGSPAPRSQSTTPQRSSHLSIPSVVTTSNAGSHDERSMEDDDDDNIDELVAKYQSSSRLGISRNSIGDSRESLASVYSDAGEINYGRIPVTGEITFGLEYDHKLSALKINIKGCHDIAPVDTKHNRSDPYVKVYLLPDKTRSGKRKSKIKKHTLNPVFNETLSYNISQGELENRTLWVAVWHSDRFGRNDFLGEVIIPMDMYRFDDPTPCTYTLQARLPDTMNEEAMQYKGDLIVSLKYVTPNQIAAEKKPKSKSKKSKQAADSQGELHVMIKSAKNLTAARSNGTSDPFVKGYLLPDRGRTGKQKTSVVKNSVNPTWNHILTFNGVDAMELGDRSLELTVWDHEKLGTNEFLGGARLNLGHGFVKGELQVDWMDARGQESVAWQNMMAQPNTWIDAKLPLRASMGKATAKK